MPKFLKDSGYEPSNRVCVLSDGARDLAAVATALPHASRWGLDWAHIGRMLQYVDQAIAPLAYGRLTPAGSAFELWDLFVRFRSWVWTGETKRWKVAGEKLCELLALREQGDPTALRKRAQAARYKLMDLLYYLQANLRSLIDYRSWQLAGRRISTGFVESTINRIVGRRMCKGQQMRWARLGAHCLVQVRVAALKSRTRGDRTLPVSLAWRATHFLALVANFPPFLTASFNSSIRCNKADGTDSRPLRGDTDLTNSRENINAYAHHWSGYCKNVFQVHGVDRHGKTVLQRKLRRAEVLKFFSKLEPSLIGIEACHGSHFWARELTSLGHMVRLVPTQYVKPFLVGGKNDANDAAAICAAVT